MTDDPDFQAAVAQLTNDLELGEPLAIHRLPGGRNNRVFRVDTASRPLLLKHYHRDAYDPRDRLAADFGFTRFAWESGVRDVAEPLATAPLFGLALYEFVSGRRLQPSDVTAARVDAAVDFVAALNRQRKSVLSLAMPFASEACFSIVDHVETVASRVRRLQIACGVEEAGSDIVARLATLWSQVQKRVEKRSDVGDPTPAERCLSPSDFGFHNALLRDDGSLLFHDFEYAGWDDPAKLTCDFFSQLEIPVSCVWLDAFANGLSRSLDLPPSYRQRVDLLLSVYRVKWCCIVLNDLLPEAIRRRRFAAESATAEDDAARIAAQMQLAHRLLDDIEAERHGVR